MKNKYDAVVIGAGPSGIHCAVRLAETGRSVLLVDSQLGGNYVRSGSVISNTLLHLSSMYGTFKHKTQNFIEFKQEQSFTFDFKKARKYVEQVGSKFVKTFTDDLKNAEVDYIQGTASFADKKSILIENDEMSKAVHFDAAVISTGSTSFDADIQSTKRMLSTANIFELEVAPSKVTVVGGGFVGAEFATFFKRIGTEVTVIEKGDRLLKTFDPQLSKKFEDALIRDGVEVIKNANVNKIEKVGNKSIIFMEDGSQLESEEIFVAVGRKPALDKINIQAAGIKLTQDGLPKLTAKLRTTNPDVYVIGDATGHNMLVNWAYRSAEIVCNDLCGTSKNYQKDVLPRVLYLDPEVAHVGLTEEEAKERGFDIKVIRYNFTDLEKSLILGTAKGFLKVVYDKNKRKILGCHVIGPGAGQIVQMFALFMQSKVSIDKITDYVFNHPTFAEVLSDLAGKVK